MLGLPGAWAAAPSWASQEIVIAQVGPFSGPLGVNGIANYVGAKAYFDLVNAQGGIGGRAIRLVREDDVYQPAETIRLLQLVASRDRPLAFVNLLGSANVTALLRSRVMESLGIPAVGVTPGLESLRAPVNPWLFHIHAGDDAQLRAIARHLSSIGYRRIAIVAQDNLFGHAGLASMERHAMDNNLAISAKTTMAPGSEEAGHAVTELTRSTAQAYVMILVPNSGAAFVRDLRTAGGGAPVYSMSYVTADLLVEKAGQKNAAGVALAQVTPNPRSATSPLTREFREALARFGPADSKP